MTATLPDASVPFLETIRASVDRELKTPGAAPDDGPHLIYADWLGEHGGEPERAELIRVQLRLHGVGRCKYSVGGNVPSNPRRDACHPPWCAECRKVKGGRPVAAALRVRSAALLAAHGVDWSMDVLGAFKFDTDVVRDCRDTNVWTSTEVTATGETSWQFRRGMIDSIALPLAALLPRGQCEWCNGIGWSWTFPSPQPPHAQTRRTCSRCAGTGQQPPAIDPATLAHALPALRGVRLTDREPVTFGTEPRGWESGWWGEPDDSNLDDRDSLPFALWELLDGWDRERKHDRADWKWFTRPTEAAAIEAARLALDAAAAVWVRQA